MGDFNIDLLKDDTSRPVHDYIDFIYSKSLIPTIYKPTRITETTATLIDNILSNCENIQKSAIIITDISDHMATSLVSNLNLRANTIHKRNVYYKRRDQILRALFNEKVATSVSHQNFVTF